jgi:uncharacterized protein (UPF0264 family)
MSSLLVSVRSITEAQAALRGGADLIDIKDPSRGSLGRADDATLCAIADAVVPHAPISAALGELVDHEPLPTQSFLQRARFVKIGLANAGATHWQDNVHLLRSALAAIAPDCRLAIAAYADSARAGSPLLDEVLDFAIEYHLPAMLIDTWQKDGTTILDSLSMSQLTEVCHRCREAGIELALAGSINKRMIEDLQDLQPNWFAVRGAACRLGNRVECICEQRVRDLATLIHSPSTCIPEGSRASSKLAR